MSMKCWVGLGYRTGGRVVIGLEKTVGVIYAISDPVQRVRSAFVLSEAVSVGLALGGGVGLRVIVAWGYDTSDQIEKAEVGGLDLTLDLGIEGVGAYVKSLWEVGKAGKWAKYTGTVAQFAAHYEKSKTTALELVNNMGVNPSKPGIAIFSVPVLTPGVGLEVAAAIKAESVDVTQSMIVNFADAWATEQHVKLVAGAITPL